VGLGPTQKRLDETELPAISLWLEHAVGSSSGNRWQLCCRGPCPPTQGCPHRQL